MIARARPAVGYWLLACCLMVLATTVVGGITRLTRSGLSIVEWQPLIGVVPPLTEEDWLVAFGKYQQTPEYRKVNVGMTLDEFKFIFWWEWVHRLLGRTIGLVFAVPLVWLVARRQVDRALVPRLVLFFVLGGLQGVLGWYMVKSGLVDNPWVSPYRLTAHLGLAFLLGGLMFWTALDCLRPRAGAAHAPAAVRRGAAAVAALLFVMTLSGGLVAGLRAGYAYNTFPLMHGHLVPPGLWELSPWWVNFFNNITTVQFTHRMLAWLLLAVVPLVWWQVRRAPVPPRARAVANLLVIGLLVQVSLGVTTLLLMVPLPWAAAHQGGAMLLFAVALWLNHELRCAPASG